MVAYDPGYAIRKGVVVGTARRSDHLRGRVVIAVDGDLDDLSAVRADFLRLRDLEVGDPVKVSNEVGEEYAGTIVGFVGERADEGAGDVIIADSGDTTQCYAERRSSVLLAP